MELQLKTFNLYKLRKQYNRQAINRQEQYYKIVEKELYETLKEVLANNDSVTLEFLGDMHILQDILNTEQFKSLYISSYTDKDMKVITFKNVEIQLD